MDEKTVRRGKKIIGIKTRKKVAGPKYVKDQPQRCKKNCRKLYKLTIPSGGSKILFVLDDETYVPADPSQVPGVEHYNELPGVPLDPSQKIKPKQTSHCFHW